MANVFDLSAILRLNTKDYEKGLNDSEGKGNKFLNGLGKVAGGVGKLIGGAAKMTMVGVGALVTAGGKAVVDITKQATDAYANFEQLEGGVKKLYGNMGLTLGEYATATGQSVGQAMDEWKKLEVAQRQVLRNAQNAYKTAGMSANEYMEIATSFSAALINSLDGDTMAAADATDVAMRAIADNWNTFGGDIGSIQNAFQGFAKQNYTMLDNLKLGYGGTKSEMERLIADANEYAKTIGETGDMSIDSFADIVRAIDLVQKKQNIAGTTARESASTISGSLGSLKAAWQNLLTGMASGDDITNLITSVVDGAKTLLGNVMPVVQQTLGGIVNLVTALAPIIVSELPGMIETILPPLIASISTLVQAVVADLPEIVQVLIAQVPNIVKMIVDAFTNLFPAIFKLGIDLLMSIANGIIENLPTIIPAVVDIVNKILDTLLENADLLIEAAVTIIETIALGLVDHLPELVEKSIFLVIKIVEAIISATPRLLNAAGAIIDSLLTGISNALTKIWNSGVQVVTKFLSGIGAMASSLVAKGKSIIQSVKNGIVQSISDAWNWGKDLIQNFIDGITAKFRALKEKISNIANTVKSFLGFSEPEEGPLSDFHTYAPDMMMLFAKGIKDNEKKVRDQLEKSFDFDDMLTANELMGDVSVNARGVSGGGTVNAPSNVNIQVYASDGMDIDTLAEKIMRKFTLWERQRQEGFA